jgi:SAM-dependent methyltransferase
MYNFNDDPIISRYRTPAVEALTLRLTTESPISLGAFDRCLRRGIRANEQSKRPLGGQEKYVEFHKTRLWEIANMSKILLGHIASPNRNISILDFGYSVNTLVLEFLYPDHVIYSADRPNINSPERIGDRGFSVDLSEDNIENSNMGMKFDLIIFSEVLEHVLANPTKILKYLIKHLTPDGYIIITTLNFFSFNKMNLIRQRLNPQPIYPETYKAIDAPHFHIREYSMGELLQISEKAEGTPAAFFFSGCWDSRESLSRLPNHELSNICIIVKNALENQTNPS